MTSTADSGAGTLRQAVLDAQAGTKITFDTSVFDPNAQATIVLASALNNITVDSVTFDASNAGVTLDGNSVVAGLTRFNNPACVIKGFDFKGFTDDIIRIDAGFTTVGGTGANDGNVIGGAGGYGIRLTGSDSGTMILGNYIGTNRSFEDLGNTLACIYSEGTGSFTVGGTAAGAENHLCFNDAAGTSGLLMLEGDVTVLGNFFGTNSSGDDLGNHNDFRTAGGAATVQIGGSAADEANTFGHANQYHLFFDNSNTGTNTIQGNFIGTDSSNRDLGCNNHAIAVNSGFTGHIEFGGSGAGEGNIVAFALFSSYLTLNSTARIRGNYFGTNANGDDLGNGRQAFNIFSTMDAMTIGGSAAGEGNTIGWNNRQGILSDSNFATGSGTIIEGNYIGTNANGISMLNGLNAIEFSQNSGVHTIGDGNVIVTTQDAIEYAASSTGTIELSGTVSIDGMIDINGGTFDMNSASLIVSGDIDPTGGTFTIGTNSTITLDGNNQTLTSITSFENLHFNGKTRFENGLFQLGTYTIDDSLVVESGAVTAPGVTVTFNTGADIKIGSGASSPAVISMDSATFQSDDPGTTRFTFTIEPGGDIHANQSTKFDSLDDAGMVFKTGSSMGSNTSASNGSQNFRFVTYDNIGDGGLGIDFSDLVAGDDNHFPEILREFRFNIETGATTAQNVKGGDAVDPRFVFHINTSNFGSVAVNGESGDDDPNNRIIWNITADYIGLEHFKALGNEALTNIQLIWKTIVELANKGFNLYRSKDKHQGFVKINTELIEPGGPGNGIEGYEYLYEDLDVKPGEVFYYKLEDIDQDGTRTFHGPVTVDWDRDGIADDWEIANGFDNLDASDAQADADGDGLSNLDEYLYGFDPHNADSDNDGIPDGEEDLIPSEQGSGPGINVGSALTVIGQDELGMTLELNLEGLDIKEATKLWAPWKDNIGYRRWSSKDFNQITFKGDLKFETLNQKGLPAVPVCHTLFNVPENRLFETKIILEEWGQTEILPESLAPVPTYQDVPVFGGSPRNLKNLRGFKKRGQGKLWKKLFGMDKNKAKKAKRKFKKKRFHERHNVVLESETSPQEPQTELIEIYAMDPSVYGEDKFYPETHFSAQKRSQVGDQQTILLAVQPVKYNPQRGELKHLKRLRFRIDYIWDPDHLAKTTAQWQQHYNKLNHAKPEYLKQDVSLKFEVSKPGFNALVGDLNDAGLFKLTWQDFEAAGYDVSEAKKDPGRIRVFQGDVELSLKEIVEESEETSAVTGFVFFTNSGLNETLFSNKVVLYAFYDPENPGKRWGKVTSEANFDQELEFSEQRIRYEDNKPQNLGVAYLQDRVGNSFYFGPNAFKTSAKSVAFGTPGILPDQPVELISRFWGVHPQETEIGQGLHLTLNSEETPFASPQWPGQAYHQEKVQLSGDQFVSEGTNTFKFQGYFPSEVPTSTKIRSRFDWIEVFYKRDLKALNDHYLIDMSFPEGISRIAIKGFSEESQIVALDVSDAGDVKEIVEIQRVVDEVSFNYKNPKEEVMDSVYYPNFLRIDSDYGHDDPNGRGNFGFGTDTGSVESLEGVTQMSHPNEFYADRYGLTSREVYEGVHHKGPRLLLADLSNARSIEKPEISFRGFIRHLHAPLKPITHMIVVAKPLMEECERLKDHLETQGQNVEMVSFEDLCKEYTFGQYSSNAIYLYVQERFLMSFNPKPKYLTIVGSGNLDVSEFYTNFLSEKPLIPSVIVRGGIKVAAADGVFSLITRDKNLVDRFPDICVGRLDCGTVEELSAVIDKIQNYDSLQLIEEEPNRAILVADEDAKIGDIFENELDKAEQSFEMDWQIKRLHRSEFSGSTIANEIVNDLHANWVQLLLYSGHGNFPTWSDLFSVGNVGQLNSNLLPFVVETNCQAADYFHFAIRSLGTHLLQRPNGGAIAVTGTTSRTNANDKISLLYLITDNLLRRGYPQFGEAIWRAKVEALTTDPDERRAILTQHLLGLPSQKIKSGLESKP